MGVISADIRTSDRDSSTFDSVMGLHILGGKFDTLLVYERLRHRMFR